MKTTRIAHSLETELLTLKALKAIQNADAILYDALISKEI
jgi:siroheme synthase